jgi:hypothetical protein
MSVARIETVVIRATAKKLRIVRSPSSHSIMMGL